MKWVVLTGASSGIGWATTEKLFLEGFSVFASVRKTEDAKKLTDTFGDKVVPLMFDVTDEEAVKEAGVKVAGHLDDEPLTGLINNAGVGIGGPLLEIPLEQFRKQIEVNLIGVLHTTQAFAPLLKAKGGKKAGRVIHIGSAGGKVAYPFMGPYHTSKFGLEGFNESLRRELMILDIESIIVAPASIDTPIWSKADDVDFSQYENTAFAKPLRKFVKSMHEIGESGLKPEKVADVIYTALTAHNPKTRYAISGNPVQQFLAEHLPKRWIDKIMAKQLGYSD